MYIPNVDDYDEESVYKREYLKDGKDKAFQQGIDIAIEEMESNFDYLISSITRNEYDNIQIFDEISKQVIERAKNNIMFMMHQFANEMVISKIDEYSDEETHFDKEHERFIKMKNNK